MAMRDVSQAMECKRWWIVGVVCCVALVGFLAMPRPDAKVADGPAAKRESASADASGQPEKLEPAAAIPESKRHADDSVEKDRAEKGKLRDLEKAVAEQETKLTAARKALGAVVRDKGIVYQGPDGNYSGRENPNAKEDAGDYIRNRLAVDREFKVLLRLQTELEKEKARLGIASPPEAK
jgi:hypothetical protein